MRQSSRQNAWKSPNECVKILNDYMFNETVLTLIVTETWINVDVTISSFQPRPVGAYGNVEYSITFVQKKPLKIYSTNELKIAAFVRKTKPRASSSSNGGNYTVVSGDTLWGIASKKLGSGTKWTTIYDANKDTIESTAKKHGKEQFGSRSLDMAGRSSDNPGIGVTMIDLTKIQYRVVVMDESKNQYNIKEYIENLGWEENDGELSVRTSFVAKNDKTSKGYLSKIIKPGCLVGVFATDGASQDEEVARGYVETWNPGLKRAEDIR